MHDELRKKLYVPINQYKYKNTYLKIVNKNRLKKRYRLRTSSYYHYIEFESNSNLPKFGWKIHVSGKNSNAEEILDIVATYCIEKEIDFKVILDENLLSTINSKQWDRSSSGKFITIYPNSTPEFLFILEELDKLLGKFDGPYILSDKRYKNSNILFYRFGRINSNDNEPLIGPNGELFNDNPQPYYQKPSWLEDPINDGDISNDEDENEDDLLGGRYLIKDVLHFTNCGGVYLAMDTLTGNDVVIKEARPHTSELAKEIDAVYLQNIEKKILIEMEKYELDFVPTFIDSFKEWEHHYLVQSYIDGLTLSQTISTPENVQYFRLKNREKIDELFYKIYEQIMLKLNTLWKIGITHGDITPENVLIDDTGKVYLIDFELAITNNIKNPAIKYLETDGFRISKPKEDFSNRFIIDRESLGLTLLRMFCSGNKLVFLNKNYPRKYIKALYDDSILSEKQCLIIDKLIYNQEERNYLRIDTFETASSNSIYAIEEIVNQSCRFIYDNTVSDTNNVCLFNTVKTTQMFSYFYGDYGILKTLKNANYDIDYLETQFKEKLKQKLKKGLDIPEYLQVALCMSDFHMEKEALSLLKKDRIPISEFYLNNKQKFTIFNGVIGAGLAYISLFYKTKNLYYLNEAERYANFVINEIEKYGIEQILVNKIDNKLGFYEGLSGIPYFLLKIFKLTNIQRFFSAARLCIKYIISLLVRNPTGTYLEVELGKKTYSPSLNGSIGFVKTLNYYSKFNDEFQSLIFDLIEPIDFKYCKNATYLTGLAGIGEVILECYKANPQNNKFLKIINQINEGIILLSNPVDNYTVFASNESNIKLNYIDGMSGTIHYLVKVLQYLKKESFVWQ